jgi:hypothetical protein
MSRYTKLSDNELNDLLMLAYYPKRRERLNLNIKEIFTNTIIEKIIENDLLEELGDNVIKFLPFNGKDKHPIGVIIVQSFMSDIRVIKMAALKTYDDFEGMIK